MNHHAATSLPRRTSAPSRGDKPNKRARLAPEAVRAASLHVKHSNGMRLCPNTSSSSSSRNNSRLASQVIFGSDPSVLVYEFLLPAEACAVRRLSRAANRCAALSLARRPRAAVAAFATPADFKQLAPRKERYFELMTSGQHAGCARPFDALQRCMRGGRLSDITAFLVWCIEPLWHEGMSYPHHDFEFRALHEVLGMYRNPSAEAANLKSLALNLQDLSSFEEVEWINLAMHFPKLETLRLAVYPAPINSISEWQRVSQATSSIVFDHCAKLGYLKRLYLLCRGVPFEHASVLNEVQRFSELAQDTLEEFSLWIDVSTRAQAIVNALGEICIHMHSDMVEWGVFLKRLGTALSPNLKRVAVKCSFAVDQRAWWMFFDILFTRLPRLEDMGAAPPVEHRQLPLDLASIPSFFKLSLTNLACKSSIFVRYALPTTRPKLQTLDLRWQYNTEEHVVMWCSLTNCPALTSLSLDSECLLDFPGLFDLLPESERSLWREESRNAKFSDNSTSTTSRSSSSRSCSAGSSLADGRSLSLSSSGHPLANPRLETLRLTEARCLRRAHCDTLLWLFPRLTRLHLHMEPDFQLDTTAFLVFLTRCVSLRKLILSGIRMRLEWARQVAARCPQLTYVYMEVASGYPHGESLAQLVDERFGGVPTRTHMLENLAMMFEKMLPKNERVVVTHDATTQLAAAPTRRW